MYGLLLDTIQKFIREKYGENSWANIRRRAKLSNHWFVTHEVYPESLIPTLVDAAAEELGEDRDNVMRMFGEYFAQNIGRYGYARLLRVLGRNLRDFLNGLVDLHEYLRFSYPNMSPPAFFTANETPEGLHLHYITKREGFLCYVMGQMRTIGRIYGKQLEITLLSKNETEKGEFHIILELKFDNQALLEPERTSVVGSTDFQISSEAFFKMFPFSFIFSKELVVCRVGAKLQEVLPGLCGEEVTASFTLLKPYMSELDWDSILLRTNCTFELQSVRRVQYRSQEDEEEEMGDPEQTPRLKLKGEMMILDDKDHVAFLCSPSMDSPEDLYASGIFISDLSLHNCSREFIMAGSQKHPELNIAFNQERIRSAQLETSIKKTDELLYQMIPKSIADKLRSGHPPLSTCQEFDSVSILFSDIVSFTPMCSRLGPMQVVGVLNTMSTAYDRLCEKFNVYKVEMIGDAYMALAGGPIMSRPNVHHVESITNYGLEIIEATKSIIDPSTGKHLRIRVGIHSGGIVAGVVGTSTQRYDVFGDTVNIAARMESTGEPMRIQMSEATASLLQARGGFILAERGQVEVKGKGLMKTFWVDGREQPSLQRDPRTTSPCATPSRNSSLGAGIAPSSRTSTPPGGGLAGRLPPTMSLYGSLRNSRSSPAPDEWPQAEQRLADRSWLHYSRNHRSYTLPNIDITGVEHELQSLLQCPFDHGNPPLSATGESPYTSFPYPPPPSSPTPPQQQNRGGSSGSGDFLAVRRSNSERNVVPSRQSLAQGLATIQEHCENVSLAQLSNFAILAEENAKMAQRFADAAAQLVRERKRSSQQNDFIGIHDHGSSVDPAPLLPFSSRTQSRPYLNYCAIL